jgi:hypothetical protein
LMSGSALNVLKKLVTLNWSGIYKYIFTLKSAFKQNIENE